MIIKSEKDFLSDIERFKLDNIYLLVGKDSQRKKIHLKQLYQKISSEFDVVVISSQKLDENFLTDLFTPPLFSTKRIIIVDDFEKIKTQEKRIITSYFEKPSNSTVLFLLYNDELKNYEIKRDYENTNITVVIFPQLTQSEIKEKIQSILAKNDITLDEKALDYLSSQILDFSHLINEVEKITAYAQKNKNISLTEIKNITFPLKETQIYEVSESLLSLQLDKFKDALNNLIEQKEEPLYILNSIGYALEKMLKLKMITKRHPTLPYEIVQILSLNRFDLEKSKNPLFNKITEEHLLKAIDYTLEIENQLKSQAHQDSYLLLRYLGNFILELMSSSTN